MRPGNTPNIEDRADEDAADGILVAEVRGLGAISREVSEPAAHRALVAPLRRVWSTVACGALPNNHRSPARFQAGLTSFLQKAAPPARASRPFHARWVRRPVKD